MRTVKLTLLFLTTILSGNKVMIQLYMFDIILLCGREGGTQPVNNSVSFQTVMVLLFIMEHSQTAAGKKIVFKALERPVLGVALN